MRATLTCIYLYLFLHFYSVKYDPTIILKMTLLLRNVCRINAIRLNYNILIKNYYSKNY